MTSSAPLFFIGFKEENLIVIHSQNLNFLLIEPQDFTPQLLSSSLMSALVEMLVEGKK